MNHKVEYFMHILTNIFMSDKKCVLTSGVTWMWCRFMTTLATTADILIFLNERVSAPIESPIFATKLKIAGPYYFRQEV